MEGEHRVEPGGEFGVAVSYEKPEALGGIFEWLVTTNDNLDALRLYQRRGMRLVAVHRGAVDQARLVKPQIPEAGAFRIAVHDEIELELELPQA